MENSNIPTLQEVQELVKETLIVNDQLDTNILEGEVAIRALRETLDQMESSVDELLKARFKNAEFVEIMRGYGYEI